MQLTQNFVDRAETFTQNTKLYLHCLLVEILYKTTRIHFKQKFTIL